MSILEVLGYVGALCVGLVMGMLGGGGSILSVPILAYLFNLDEKIATAYSLFIVGITALFGGIREVKGGMVDSFSVFVFGIPSVIGVSIVRAFIIPSLPEVLFHINTFEVTRRMGMFGLFVILMIWAAFSMLYFPKTDNIEVIKQEKRKFHPLFITEGFFIGGLTGLVGAGGGFLIVPALMLMANLDIKRAVGTSLFIVTLNSLIGFFVGDFYRIDIDWYFISSFVVISVIGMYIGTNFSRFVDQVKMKTIYAIFLVCMAIVVFVAEFILIKTTQ